MVVGGETRGRLRASPTDDSAELDEALANAAVALRTRLGTEPEVLVVLGSGLVGVSRGLRERPSPRLIEVTSLQLAEIPGLPPPGAEGHRGRIVAARLEGRPVLVQEGRFHLYEGLGAPIVTAPVRLAAHAGARTAILTNSSGGVRPELAPGTLLLLRDHLNLMGPRSCTEEAPGPVGPSSGPEPVYDGELARVARSQAREMRLPLVSGTYAAMLGPSYETRAEVGVLARAGADVVGMSTVPEAIVARGLGMRVLALAIVTNRAGGGGEGGTTHRAVLELGDRMSGTVAELIARILRHLPV